VDRLGPVNDDEGLVDWLRRTAPEVVDDLERLQKLLTLVEQYQLDRWKRHVSVGDSLVDRWERAKKLGFGSGSSVYDSALVIGDVRVGINTWIGPNTVLDGSGGLTIGDNCSISTGVQIYSHDTIRRALSGGVAGPERAATSIGSNSYLGPNVIVVKGITIGTRCLIGAGSVVLVDIPDATVSYGIPARAVGPVEDYLLRESRPGS
jgi:acetyltransferase-like isoleucine patch superfamily enzyme